ncbi:hypothetical protein CDD81_3445 [Ophiocordyceps australis]|uniref:NADP-dependent oxidoreductase domain-containing protein n=1 Tax=Ophiocordyceps australis TaxID=1399860 RepID=A0A2C5Y8K5_9HYPO|nr:hypothetical protein CDD81_3445 [Ophiocordyceps australis]
MPPLNQTARTFTLNTGHRMPAIGLGTWRSPSDKVQAAVKTALGAGYRHIDTAAAYENEAAVGAGIRASGVPRHQIWITTKLFNYDHKQVARALDESLGRLGVEYVDLYLMHWPCSVDAAAKPKAVYKDWDFCDTWREMQKLVGTGKVRNIGISNFETVNLQKLLAHPDCKARLFPPPVVPAVNQVELHPGYPSPKLFALNSKHGIHTTAYSCLGSQDSPLYQDSTLLQIAKAKAKTPQQVLLMWGLQKGWSVIPKSVTPSRIEDNFKLDGWELTADQVKEIDGISEKAGTFKVCDDKWLPARVFDSELQK